MINVTFSHNSSDNRTLSKTLTPIGTSKPCAILDDSSILRPRLKLAYDATLMTSNYLYIPEWNRFYYIDELTVSQGYIYITAHVDVLRSFKTEILNCTAVIDRQEHVYNKYLPDNRYEAYSYEILSAYAFSTPFTKASIPYITVIGGN